MMRLDKFLSDINLGTRSEVKNLIKKGLISVDEAVCKKCEEKIDENKSLVTYNGETLRYIKYHYFILNKPGGYVCANTDFRQNTVLDLFNELTYHKYKDDFFCCGRLDIDTTGLLLITNDGPLAHKLLSPKFHVDKTYLVTCLKPLTQEDLKSLEEGVDIGEDYLTKSAKAFYADSMNEIYLTIHEGKFHQVKRMIKAVNNEVTKLKRISFGPLKLPEDLKEGFLTELDEKKIEELKNV